MQWMPLDLQKSRSFGLYASQIAVDYLLFFGLLRCKMTEETIHTTGCWDEDVEHKLADHSNDLTAVVVYRVVLPQSG